MIFIDERYSINMDMKNVRENKIYNAFDRLNDEPVIIKLLKETSKIKDDFVRNIIDISTFINEKKPSGVLKIKKVDRCKLGNHGNYIYIVYENIKGVTLSNIMEGNYLDKYGISSIAMGIFRTLSNMEDNFGKKIGYHGSLKSEDIIIDKNYNIKVADFGITAANRGKNIEAEGNIDYMSIFQLGINHTDYQSDIFSAGIIIYEMIFGKKPFISSNDKKQMLRNMNKTPDFKLKTDNRDFDSIIELDKKLLDMEKNDIKYEDIIKELMDITLEIDKKIKENTYECIDKIYKAQNKINDRLKKNKIKPKIIIFVVVIVLIIINTIYFIV